MKRKGRQHGMVRTYPILSGPGLNPRHQRMPINELSTPPTAGLFSKVPTKPTNHSKFTGKCDRPMCRGCHASPACKSKAKVKGAHKTKSSSDLVSDARLVSWRVVDSCGGPKMRGFSATGVLDYLDNLDRSFCDDDGEIEGQLYDADDDDVNGVVYGDSIEIEEVTDDGNNDDDDDDDDDDHMSFCEVGYVWEPLDEDEWCLVME